MGQFAREAMTMGIMVGEVYDALIAAGALVVSLALDRFDSGDPHELLIISHTGIHDEELRDMQAGN